MAKCLERIRGVHGSLDRTQFIPMIILNVTTHHALSLNQRVNQSQIPLQIMMLPMRTQAATMGAGLKFIEFLSKRVLALDVKLGPAPTVILESGGEGASVQSTSGAGGKATPMVAFACYSSHEAWLLQKHHSPATRHPRLVTLMVPQRPKLQTCLQNPGRCSVPEPLLHSPSSWA